MNALQPVTSGATTLRDNARQVLESESRAGSIARALRDEMTARPFRLYMAVVISLAVFYYLVIATPLFVSQTQFALQNKTAVPTVSMLSSITGGTTAPGLTQLTETAYFIQSQEMLDELNKKLHLRTAYTQPRLDFLNYLSPSASQYQFLSFYNSMISVAVDTDTNIITLQCKSYEAKTAQGLCQAILDGSSKFVDALSEQMRLDSIRAAQIDYNQALRDDIKAKDALTSFHKTVGNLDPTVSGSTATSSITTMQGNIDALNTQIASLMTYSTASSPQVQQLQVQVNYWKKQIDDTNKQMLSTTNKNSINAQLNKYHDLSMDMTYKDTALVTAQTALDQAKSVASQQTMYVVAITHPNLPDWPTSPNRVWAIFTVVALAATMYGLIRLGIAGVRDHQGE